MYVCKFQEGQGLGNQLWNYVSIKAIANDSNKPFGVINLDLFKGKDFINLNCQQINEPSKLKLYKEKLFFDEINNYISSDFDNDVYSLDGNYVLEGLFQSEKYIHKHLNSLDNFLPLNSKTNNDNEKICILNIRGGEYKKHSDFILPKSYWENAIDIMKSNHGVTEFEVVTDDYDYAKFLFPELKITSNNIEKCYKKIHKAKYLIISNSTFSYFPIKTGIEPISVIAPYKWARFNSDNDNWCSPSNCYEGWHYLDKYGVIHDFISASVVAAKTSQKYIDGNCLYDETKHHLKKNILLNIIPKPIKNIVKKVLAYFIPSKF